jgi:hypothetical protein
MKFVNKRKPLKYLNEFIVISIPRLLYILKNIDVPEKNLLRRANILYEELSNSLEFNAFEKYYLDKNYDEDIDTILNYTENTPHNLQKVKTVIENNKRLRDDLSSSEDEKDREIRITNSKRILIDNAKNNLFIGKERASKFKEMALKEIDDERNKYIREIVGFFKTINEIKDISKENIMTTISFFVDYCSTFTNHYKNNILKNEIFFFYWTDIFLMQFNQNDNKFEESNAQYNKEYFNDLSLIEFTIEQFENINLNYNNYENLLYIKFLDSYLDNLDEDNRAKFLIAIIEKPESRNLFHLLHNILDSLFVEIKSDFEGNITQKENMFSKCPSSVYEIEIKEYDIIIKF